MKRKEAKKAKARGSNRNGTLGSEGSAGREVKRARGIETSDEPGQEDFGWYFDFKVSGQFHTFVLGFQPNRPEAGDQWIGSVERAAGFLSSIFGGRRKNILPEAIECLNQVLISAPEIRDVQWHEFGKIT